MPTISLLNKQTHYAEWGTGEKVIVMLHGWPADSSHYQEIGPLLAQSGFHVIVPDLPGWGQTDAFTKAADVNDYAEWVHGFLEQMQVRECVLFGHSFGGRLAIKYTVKYPYQVKALVLCAAAGIKTDATSLKRKLFKTAAKTGNVIFAAPGLNKLAPGARKWLYKLVGTTDYLKATGAMKETIVKVLEEDLTPFLPQIKRPTLILWGTEDGATPLSDGKKMHQMINGSEFITFEGARHNLPKNEPAKVADEMLTFLKQEQVQVII